MLKEWGRGSPLIVAEISCNHMGVERNAHALVEAAALAGADAVKVARNGNDEYSALPALTKHDRL